MLSSIKGRFFCLCIAKTLDSLSTGSRVTVLPLFKLRKIIKAYEKPRFYAVDIIYLVLI